MAEAGGTAWRPGSEAEAASNMAVFVEWLRATGRRPDATPDAVRAWWREAPEPFLASIAAFVPTAPHDPEVLAALARHLLADETRPDDVVEWPGDPEAPWPRAARLLGAAVVFPLTLSGADPDAAETPPRSSR